MYMATEKKQATKIDTTLDHSLKATEGTVTPAYALTRLHLVHLGLGLRRLEDDGLRANRKRMSSYELLLPKGRMMNKGWIRPELAIARKPNMYVSQLHRPIGPDVVAVTSSNGIKNLILNSKKQQVHNAQGNRH